MPEEMTFDSIALPALDGMADAARDGLPFGVVGFAADTIVQVYNAT